MKYSGKDKRHREVVEERVKDRDTYNNKYIEGKKEKQRRNEKEREKQRSDEMKYKEAMKERVIK